MRPSITITSRAASAALALILFLTASAAAFAHEGFEHVTGTVANVTAQSVTVTTTASKTVEVALNGKTTYTRGKLKVAAGDLKIGDRVVIDATGEAPKLVAASVKIGAAAAGTAAHDDHVHK